MKTTMLGTEHLPPAKCRVVAFGYSKRTFGSQPANGFCVPSFSLAYTIVGIVDYSTHRHHNENML